MVSRCLSGGDKNALRRLSSRFPQGHRILFYILKSIVYSAML